MINQQEEKLGINILGESKCLVHLLPSERIRQQHAEKRKFELRQTVS